MIPPPSGPTVRPPSRLLAVALLSALVVVACTSGGGGEIPPPSPEPEPERDPVASVRMDSAAVLLDEVGPRESLGVLLDLPRSMGPEDRGRALELVRTATSRLTPEQVAEVLQATPLGQPLAAPLMVAYGRSLLISGEAWQAARFARGALDQGAEGADAEAARALLARARSEDPAAAEGLPAPGEGEASVLYDLGGTPATVGVVLPRGGPPTLRRYAELIEEGVRAALEGEGAPAGLRIEVADDRGTAAGASAALATMRGEGIVGVVGPLEEESLVAAADARPAPWPIISPTAPGTGGREGVFTLGGPDPGAARVLARYARESGLDPVVILHPGDPEAQALDRTFREEMEARGGSVLRTLTYPAGTTSFADVLETIRFLEPRALFLPVPVRDIQALAPQISFYGLDSLGVRVLGTADWASPDVLREVSPRHTNGVVLASTRPPGSEPGGFARFVQAYEGHFRRSLRDPVSALGWDAASLLTEAMRSGARSPAAMTRALNSIRGFPGATGELSVEDGRIVRTHHLVCIQDGELAAVPEGEPPVAHRPERPGRADEGEPERVPLGPLQVYCPGTVILEDPGMEGVR